MLPWVILFLFGLTSIYLIFQKSIITETDNKDCKTFDGIIGTCTILINCSMEDIENPNYNQCPPNYICCPTISPRSILESKYDLLPSDCGVSISYIENRITRGNKADLFEFPWQVALKYVSHAKRPFFCGGTLINNRYILTAAHCIISGSKLLAVRLGEYDFDSDRDCVKFGIKQTCAPKHVDINVSVKDAIVHEKYSKVTLQNDIALIRLPSIVQFNDNIAPICLPIKKYAKEEFTELTVSGWGRTEHHNTSQVLLKVIVPYMQTSLCKARFGRPVVINQRQLCAGGTDGKDSCTGDSGGPIMYSTENKGVGRWIQVGLVSFGSKLCGTKHVPGVYTRLTAYMDWILNHMKP